MAKLWKRYKEASFILKVSVMFVAGIILGLLIGDQAIVLKPVGTLLIHLLSFVAIPIVFLTVILAVNQMNIATLGKLGAKLIFYYTATTAAAVLIGISLALWISPGKGLTLPHAPVDPPQTPHISDILLQVVPENLFSAFASGDLLAIMFTAIVMGAALSAMNFSKDSQLAEQGQLLGGVVAALNKLFYKILDGVLLVAPIGIGAISAVTFGTQGLGTLLSLSKFLAVFYLGILIHWTVVYTFFLRFAGFHVIPFLKDTKEAYGTAFFTSSSLASLPVAIKSAQKAGISERVANFSLPLGAVFNSDGGALRMGASIVFAANIMDLNLSFSDLFLIVLIGTVISVGTAGVPAAGLITLSVVLGVFGLPLEIVALIAGIDALIGMGGTASNVMGDIVGAAFIDGRKHRKSPAFPE
ncbi:dicarboxylate/amino acid:cation symporter [Bhargavaea cecembensis]|uniref:dicarboxylate/amino acid:cation symporter n=1 Tax=Bhargavaea cecembensis TaxID=394098 RepID=UPI0009E1A815|nr:dicarboxylate/amino acid:cation symporter [Bhargavaea cecembensis]